MNTRKFTYIISIVVGLFLFVLGTVFLFYINTVSPGTGELGLPSIFSGLSVADKNKPMNFLLLVGDKASGNTDSMLVANYDPTNNHISLVTIPRDTKVKIKNSSVPKINSAYAAGGHDHEGATYASKVISELTGININYYVYINISSVKKITNMLGGVNFDVPADLRYDDPTQDLHINLKKGPQLLDGNKVEQLLRFRKPDISKYSKAELRELQKYYDGSDIKRTETQVKFIKEFINQKLNLKYLPMFNSVINYAFENVVTNISLAEALKLTSGLINISSDNLKSFRLDGEDKLINSGWYYVYNGKIINIETKESLPAEEVVAQYFKSDDTMAAPSQSQLSSDKDDQEDSQPTKKTTVKPKKKNPSNNQTNTKGTGKDKP